MLMQDSRMSSFPYVWTAAWTVLGVVAVWYLAVRENDELIKYKVPAPKLPEKHEILENPSIRVCYHIPCQITRTETNTRPLEIRNNSNPMLRARHRPVPRLHQPLHTRRHRPSPRTSQVRTDGMGNYHLPPAPRRDAEYAPTRPRQPGADLQGRLSRLG